MTATLDRPAATRDVTLDTALAFLRERVAPRAAELDRSPEALAEALREAGDAGLLALKRPLEYGGPALGEADFRVFQEECARASGSFAFLQTQHQAAGGMIARHAEPEFAARLLPHMANGDRLVGVGFSQLRRGGPPLVRAEPQADGAYLATGHVPWATGGGIFREYLLGATLPTGESLFAVVPLGTVAGQTMNPPMRLAAMESAQTVTLDLDGLLVPPDAVAFVKPPEWIRDNDNFNIALQSGFAFGCVEGSLDVLRAQAQRPGKEFVAEYADRLAAELAGLRARTAASASETSEESAPMRLTLRAEAVELAVRCAHAAVTASSGAANSLDHPAQRLYREALVYTVSAQTLPIMRATLDLLTGGEKRVQRGELRAEDTLSPLSTPHSPL